jgi:hypothetical protein
LSIKELYPLLAGYRRKCKTKKTSKLELKDQSSLGNTARLIQKTGIKNNENGIRIRVQASLQAVFILYKKSHFVVAFF